MRRTNPELGVELPARTAATIRKVTVMRRSLAGPRRAGHAGRLPGGRQRQRQLGDRGQPGRSRWRKRSGSPHRWSAEASLDAATLAGQPVAFWFWAPT